MNEEKVVQNVSSKSRTIAFLLCLMLGWFGVHRFYVKKYFTGILMLMTFGGFGFWVFWDMIFILLGTFRDKQALPLKNWGLS